VGGVAAAISGPEALLPPETGAESAQIQSIGDDLATRNHNVFGRGFAIVSGDYPTLGQGAFGRSGAAGSQAFPAAVSRRADTAVGSPYRAALRTP